MLVMLIQAKFRKYKILILAVLLFLLLWQLISFHHICDPLHYPLDIDLKTLSDYLISKNFSSPNEINDFYRNFPIHPINHFTFKYRHRLPENCIEETFVFFIKSSITNFKNRRLMRDAFAFYKRKKTLSIKWFFFLGVRELKIFDETVEKEMENHKDLLQVDFIDNYRNNTLKLMSEMFWARDHHCPETLNQRFIFIDDDVFINLRNIESFLLPKYDQLSIVGHSISGASPFRWTSRKWFISWDQYSCDYYPPYVSGSTIVMNKETLLKISFIIPFVKYFPFDDVYLGLVAEKADIGVTNDDKILINHKCGWFCHEDISGSLAVHIPDDIAVLREFYLKYSFNVL